MFKEYIWNTMVGTLTAASSPGRLILQFFHVWFSFNMLIKALDVTLVYAPIQAFNVALTHAPIQAFNVALTH